MAVGNGFGNWNTRRRTAPPLDVNPMDKCTIVNAYHRSIKAHKPTISPNTWLIPAPEKYGDFTLTVVGAASWWKDIDEFQPMLEVQCPSYQIANSIVNDYVTSLLGDRGPRQRPALFFVLGEHNKTTINTYIDRVSKRPFKQMLDDALTAQKTYYTALVTIADTLWARSNGNPLAIPDESRAAAIRLNLDKHKAWMQDFKALELVNCKACGSMVNPNYPICATCHNPISGLVDKN